MSDALKIIMILGFSIFCFLTFSRKLYKVLDDKNDYTLMQRFYAMNTVAIILALIVHCVAVSPILRMLAIRSEVVRVISIVVFYCIYKAIKSCFSKEKCYKNELSCLENQLLVIKNKDSFFLSNEVNKRKDGKVYYNAAFNPSAISDFILPIMQELVNTMKIEPKDFVLFLQQYHQDNRSDDQEKMLNFYKCLLETLKGVFNCKLKGEFDCKLKGIFDWKVIAINQISTILTDSVKMGEASVINYLETLIGGIVEYYCDEYIKHKGDTRLLFNVGIPPLKYQIPKEVVDRTGKPNVVMEGNYLSVSQLSDYFNDYLSKNFNRSLSKLLKNNIRFYPLNGLNPTDRISNFNLSRNILDITKDTDIRIAAQLAMSMSEIFANSYRNQKDHKEFFTYLKNNNKIIIYGGKNGLNGLGIKQSIMGKDYRKYINNAILFPTFKLSKKDPREKLDEWTSMYILKALRNQS